MAVDDEQELNDQLDRLIDQTTHKPVSDIYEAETASLARTLTKRLKDVLPLAAGAGAGAITVLASEVVLRTMRRIAQEIAYGTRVTTLDALRGLARFFGRASGGLSRLDDETNLQKIALSRSAAWAELRKQSVAALSTRVDKSIRSAVLDSIARGEKVRDAIDRAAGAMDAQWWQVERMVRTETSDTYNAAQSAGIETLQEDFPSLMKRWTERVSDAGVPFDERVGIDSVVLHGQVTSPRGVFTMPSDRRVSSKMHGASWSHPPNRPNDRAVITPWDKKWGGMAWILRDGRKINLRR